MSKEDVFKPYANNILIKTDPDITEKEGMLLPTPIPSQTGLIVEVGEGTKDDPMDIKKGTKALFKIGISQDVSNLVKEEGKFIVIDKNNILGVY